MLLWLSIIIFACASSLMITRSPSAFKTSSARLKLFRFVLKSNAQSPSWLRIQPKYHRAKMTCGFLSFFAALGFFWRGLDDKTDPYRFFHGCWHMSVGLSGACALPRFSLLRRMQSSTLHSQTRSSPSFLATT
jgi:hypothetical protein